MRFSYSASRATLIVTLLGYCASPAIAAGVHPVAVRAAAHRAPLVGHATSSGDWPQLGYDSGHSAYNPYENTIGPSNVAQLQQAWSFSAGSGNTTGNVVEAGGVVYAPSANGTLFALDASSGSLIWSATTGTGYASSGSAPVVDDGLVFTTCNIGSTQGVCALNAATGAPAWSYAVPGLSAYAGTPPVVANGSLFFEGCTSAACSYVALSEQIGHILWFAAEPQGSCAGNGGITPAVSGDLLIVDPICLGAGGDFYAMSTKSGHVKWTQGIGITATAGLAVSDEVIPMVLQGPPPPSQQQLLEFSVKTGLELWNDRHKNGGGGNWFQSTLTMPALTKQYVYVVHNGSAQAFTRKTGKDKAASFPNTASTSWPSVANGVVYTACPGRPCAFDAESLNTLWEGPMSGTLTVGVPIVANGVLYGACDGNNVCAWSLPARSRRRG